MKLSYLYALVVRLGIEKDPRINKKGIKSYSDSSILYGNPDAEIKKIIVGIDIEAAELLLADRIRSKSGLDLAISHHPEGRAYALLSNVMQLQIDVLSKAGVSREVAEKLLGERILEVERKLLPQNHMRPVDAARLLDMPLMCMHTPADNHVFSYLQGLMNKKKPKKVQNIVDILMNIPEYQQAARNSVGPRIILGSPKKDAGRILVDMTGGTEGPKEVFDKLYRSGVRSLVCMHLSEEHFKKVKDANLSVVIAGHISSDTLGLNLLLDGIEKESKETFEVISFSGFNRIKR